MKKIASILFCLLVFQGISFAKDVLKFDFPNSGWHKVESPDGVQSKKCFVPTGQSADDYKEMLIFTERKIKNEGINAMVILQKQLGKDRNNYRDIIPEFIVQEENDTMVTWCSRLKNTCSVERVFKGKDGIITAIYINKAPHYSQNMFGQWSNILATIRIADKTQVQNTNNLIELD